MTQPPNFASNPKFIAEYATTDGDKTVIEDARLTDDDCHVIEKLAAGIWAVSYNRCRGQDLGPAASETVAKAATGAAVMELVALLSYPSQS